MTKKEKDRIRFKFCMKIINDLDHCEYVVSLNRAEIVNNYFLSFSAARAIQHKAALKLIQNNR